MSANTNTHQFFINLENAEKKYKEGEKLSKRKSYKEAVERYKESMELFKKSYSSNICINDHHKKYAMLKTNEVYYEKICLYLSKFYLGEGEKEKLNGNLQKAKSFFVTSLNQIEFCLKNCNIDNELKTKCEKLKNNILTIHMKQLK